MLASAQSPVAMRRLPWRQPISCLIETPLQTTFRTGYYFGLTCTLFSIYSFFGLTSAPFGCGSTNASRLPFTVSWTGNPCDCLFAVPAGPTAERLQRGKDYWFRGVRFRRLTSVNGVGPVRSSRYTA